MGLPKMVDTRFHNLMEQAVRSDSEASKSSSHPGDAAARTGKLIDLSHTINFWV